MTHEVVDHSRRRFLTAATAVVGGVGVVSVAVPFIKSWEPSARAKAAGAPVTQSLAKIESGQQLIVGWRSSPCSSSTVPRPAGRVAGTGRAPGGSEVHRRLGRATAQLCAERNALDQARVAGDGWHLHPPGCVPGYVGEMKPEPFDPNWQGGYYCPCHHSRYDMAGRVYQGVPAPKNMQIPPYHFIDESTIQIGVDPKGAA